MALAAFMASVPPLTLIVPVMVQGLAPCMVIVPLPILVSTLAVPPLIRPS